MEPQDYAQTRAAAYLRKLTAAQNQYKTYLRRIEQSYQSTPQIGPPPHEGKRVWSWSPYWKAGTSGSLSAKWSGPWKIIKVFAPALMIVESTWLRQRGKPEIQREVVINKLKLFIPQSRVQTMLNSEEEQFAVEDPDETVTDPSVDSKDNSARLHFIQCKNPPSWFP